VEIKEFQAFWSITHLDFSWIQVFPLNFNWIQVFKFLFQVDAGFF